MACGGWTVRSAGWGEAYHHVCRPEAPVRLFFSGHLDTVYGVTDSVSSVARIWATVACVGPGVADMKGRASHHEGGVAAAFLKATGQRTRVGWEVMITADEEIGSGGQSALDRRGGAAGVIWVLFF